MSTSLSQAVLTAFAFSPDCLLEPFGQGHINRTFRLTEPDGSRYIVQRINTSVFPDPAALMQNIQRVTAYLSRRILLEGGDPLRETLSLRFTVNGDPFFREPNGEAWRVYRFIENSLCLQTCENAGQFAACARAFGRFRGRLQDFPAHTLTESIPHFHDTPRRYEAFHQAVTQDPLGRAALVQDEIAFYLEREKQAGVLLNGQRRGDLPLCVTHNDTKLNNVLLDATTGQELCVIDLDTVMPGLCAFDFGDAIRFGANHCAEDEPDLQKVQFDLHLYEVFADQYLSACAESGTALSQAETDSLRWGAKLMTLECGLRFLTDYLLGDTYFHIDFPDQNRLRCRTQMKLVSDMETVWDAMRLS